MARNPGQYVLYPTNIGDALYDTLYTPSTTNYFVTKQELDGAVGLNNELSEILANGNTTGGNNIIITDGDLITGSGGIIEMDFGNDASWGVSTDSGVYASPYITVAPLYGVLGDSAVVFGVGSGFLPTADCFYGDVAGIHGVTAGLFEMNATTTAAITAGTTASMTGGTGASVTATTGELNLYALADHVNMIATGAGKYVNIVSTNQNIYIEALNGSQFQKAGTMSIWGTAQVAIQADTVATMTSPQWNFLTVAGVGAAPADGFAMYSADIIAGNAAPHFKTEAGDVVKLYKETAAIAAAAFVANTSGIADDTATFGGYTIGQIVAALKAFGQLA